MIRVLYQLKSDPHAIDELRAAWAEIVEAHARAGHGALESLLLQDHEDPSRVLIISRWQSIEHWNTQQNDDVHPAAFARLRTVATLEHKSIFDERGVIAQTAP
ncbi:MAG: antibiotic biosynthesis monooxygenase [Bradymonadaceae bacterium]|nr:antibiotic biosynthesis monooxygenase [Lujinxingiaceae bacterium]